MQTSSPSRHRVPYGLAFPVHELVFVRAWAATRGLAMDVLLDQVLDGAEVEEMLVVRGLVRSRRTLTLWRPSGSPGGSGVVAQVKGDAPRVFGGIHAALCQAASLFAPPPARKPTPWRRLLWWRRAG
jgi:hypothetical protein